MASERPTLAELAAEAEKRAAAKAARGSTAHLRNEPDNESGDAALLRTLAAALREADEALAEIERGEGPFSVDHHQFAKNVIEAMKGRARRARGGEHG